MIEDRTAAELTMSSTIDTSADAMPFAAGASTEEDPFNAAAWMAAGVWEMSSVLICVSCAPKDGSPAWLDIARMQLGLRLASYVEMLEVETKGKAREGGKQSFRRKRTLCAESKMRRRSAKQSPTLAREAGAFRLQMVIHSRVRSTNH